MTSTRAGGGATSTMIVRASADPDAMPPATTSDSSMPRAVRFNVPCLMTSPFELVVELPQFQSSIIRIGRSVRCRTHANANRRSRSAARQLAAEWESKTTTSVSAFAEAPGVVSRPDVDRLETASGEPRGRIGEFGSHRRGPRHGLGVLRMARDELSNAATRGQ